MTATAVLTADLQRQVLLMEDDLRARLQADTEREGHWKQEHQRARDKERTAASWVAWRDDRITQAAVAWVLITVFIRFCEDNALIAPVWISGPKERRQEALDAQLAFFREEEHKEQTDREWLESAVNYLAGLPATKALVESHSALHLVSPSGDAVTRLLDFWRTRWEDGTLVHDLYDPSVSTRFLGDLYQDLSQHAKDTYALLQTPVFVEEFILDRTLEPALKDRPLEGFKLIDPACGSGHFLLGSFERLLDRWHKHAPGLELQARVQAALDTIHGVDLNPFAVAISRFRLTVAALRACGLASLETAPAFTFHLAVGDSLIHGPDSGVFPTMTDRTAFMPFTYATEDGSLLLAMLEEGTYDVVVGNPPYITVKDKALNQEYRSKFADVCKGKYALTAPFMKLFFSLAKNGEPFGWIGQITSNSFMKREFGVPLIENLLSQKDLRLVADTSGAFIPGHGTPTVIVAAQNRRATESTVRAVLGIRGELSPPKDPANGLVWRSIIDHVDQPGWEDPWVTVTDLDRKTLASHPWSLSGGGAIELRKSIDSSSNRSLGDRLPIAIGFGAVTGEDDAFVSTRPLMSWHRSQVPCQQLVEGDQVRDWVIDRTWPLLFPYDHEGNPLTNAAVSQALWSLRTILRSGKGFGGTRDQMGRRFWEYMQLSKPRLRAKFLLTYGEVATHNHFVLARGGDAVFKQTAPVIKLADNATEDEYLGLLGVLNSSTACFWLKQVCQDKGNRGGERSTARYQWEHFYQFNSSNVEDYPLPTALPFARGRLLEGLAQKLAAFSPTAVIARQGPTVASFSTAHLESDEIRAHMVSVQEELDWEVYRLYGLIEEDMTYGYSDLPGITLGERAFEIALARAIEAGEDETAWFIRHRSTQVTELPSRWPHAYRELVQRRLDVTATNPWIRLLERPEYKRRWAWEPWEKRQERALREWLLNRVEDRRFWFDVQRRPLPRSVAQLADEVSRDADIVTVLALWEGRPDVPVTQSLLRLLVDEAIPYLAAYRYKESGLRKRGAWEQTWALQRREDAGERVAPVPPPKYTLADFRKSSYWQARGKLDVPKERFIVYPDAGRETDPTPLLGWAGWDHAQQSLALSLIIGDREKDGWADDRLVPLVAGLAELQPWVDQWHSEVDPDYGVSLAAFCREQLIARAAQVGKTLDELAAWRPAPAARGRRPRKQQ